MKQDLKNMTVAELEGFLTGIVEPKYRAGQIFRWIHRGVCEFAGMSDLSRALRERLAEVAFITALQAEAVQVSAKDGTRKYLFALADGNAIESVFMRYRHGNSVCISSQAGCRMGCSFCASTIGGLSRDLTAAEMLDQVLAIGRDTGENISNVVVMGTGEPFDNYANLSRFLELIHDPRGLGLGWRALTVSTCGIVPGIEAFGRDFPQVNLAVSLHAPNDAVRSLLMPINNRYPIDALLAACRAHATATGRRTTYEYALIRGVNDQESHARELAQRLAGSLCHVNLIPLNEVAETGYGSGDRTTAQLFQKFLESKGVTTTIRREMGGDIDAACGQLRLRERG